ncbi:MAG: hypothetical protein ACI8RZ_003216 [Myxococcota bacterium]|jgi:hypothetical protein
MVCRSWLLLGLLVGTSGCKAESLGVELPRGGRDNISQEDLQRDVWTLEKIGDRAVGVEEAATHIQQRFQQMHTRPGFGRSYISKADEGGMVICAEREGQSAAPVLFLAEDPGQGAAAGAVPLAVLISAAKAFDVPGLHEQTAMLCALIGPGAVEHFLSQPPTPLDKVLSASIIGPVAAADPVVETVRLGEIEALRYTAGEIPDPDIMEAIDYREILTLTLAIYDRAITLPVP